MTSPSTPPRAAIDTNALDTDESLPFSVADTPGRHCGISVVAWVAAAVAGPLAIAVLRGVLPYDTVDDSVAVAAKVAAHPDAQSAVLWLDYLALLTLPLGVLIVSGLAIRTSPRIGWPGAVVSWIGIMSLFLTVAADQVQLAGPVAGMSVEATGGLLDALAAHPTQTVATIVFVVGHILGLILLGVALWRAVPRWAAVALIVSQPLHLLFAVIVPNHPLDAAAWSLTAAGFGMAARARR